jgi:replication-associated recombination protein RarA
MNCQVQKPLLSELLRPKSLSDLIIPESLSRKLERFVCDKQIMNVTFYGSPGIGKTSAARILMREVDADVYELNGSNYHGDKTIVRCIETFSSTYSFEGKNKVVFIEEADKLTKDVQEALRYIIENTSINCRYLMTVNDISKMTDAIQSRCVPICFDIPRKEISSIVKQAIVKYTDNLNQNNVFLDPKVVKEIVEAHFPDFRSIANNFQLEI